MHNLCNLYSCCSLCRHFLKCLLEQRKFSPNIKQKCTSLGLHKLVYVFYSPWGSSVLQNTYGNDFSSRTFWKSCKLQRRIILSSCWTHELVETDEKSNYLHLASLNIFFSDVWALIPTGESRAVKSQGKHYEEKTRPPQLFFHRFAKMLLKNVCGKLCTSIPIKLAHNVLLAHVIRVQGYPIQTLHDTFWFSLLLYHL